MGEGAYWLSAFGCQRFCVHPKESYMSERRLPIAKPTLSALPDHPT